MMPPPWLQNETSVFCNVGRWSLDPRSWTFHLLPREPPMPVCVDIGLFVFEISCSDYNRRTNGRMQWEVKSIVFVQPIHWRRHKSLSLSSFRSKLSLHWSLHWKVAVFEQPVTNYMWIEYITRQRLRAVSMMSIRAHKLLQVSISIAEFTLINAGED